ncbi:MAG: FAD-binding oxidoreductase, partial [Alphaproteobacteria bacterium]
MADLSALKTIVGPKGWSDDPDTLAPHLVEPRGLYQGASPLLLRPETTEQVAAIVKACREAGVALVPQGGNTGLCGGAMPDGQVLVSLGRMNRVRAIDALDYTITVE